MDEMELTPLKKVYDELWRDAKTMIKDMNASIKMVFFCGWLLFVVASLELLSAHQTYVRIAEGSTRGLDYFYLVMMLGSAVFLIGAGVLMIRYYKTLKNRYASVIQLKKTIED